VETGNSQPSVSSRSINYHSNRSINYRGHSYHGGVTVLNCERHRRNQKKVRQARVLQRKWGLLSREPASKPMSPLEERFAAGPKPLKPLY
jgi:hypothetical protein